MNSYQQLKNEQQKEINAFPFMFAFNEKQFAEGMAKLGLKPEETDKLYSIGAGGYIRKTDSEAMHKMFIKHDKELQACIDADTTGEGFIKDMFYYELCNHEYSYTGDIMDAIDAIGLDLEEITKNKLLAHGLKLAMQKAAEDI